MEIAQELGEAFLNQTKAQSPPEKIYQKKFDWEFKTFNDKTLIVLFDKFVSFVTSNEKTFFTISGPSEIGKTYLLKRCLEYYKTVSLEPNEDFGYPLVIFKTWESIVSDCFDDSSLVEKYSKCGRLLIDDLYPERTSNAYSAASHDLIYKILNRRLNKITIITTNKSESEILQLDPRVQSRLKRNNGQFIACNKNTTPFLERTK